MNQDLSVDALCLIRLPKQGNSGQRCDAMRHSTFGRDRSSFGHYRHWRSWVADRLIVLIESFHKQFVSVLQVIPDGVSGLRQRSTKPSQILLTRWLAQC